MKINFTTRTIEMTKKEAKEASVYKSDKYTEMMNYRKDFPEFAVVVKSSPRKAKRNCMKGLNYDFMEQYITRHGSDEDMKEFKKMTVKDKDNINPKSYGAVKAWFLDKYEEVA